MDQSFIRQTLIDRMRRHGESLDEAAIFARGMDVALSELAPVKESIRRERRRNMLLDSPPGVYGKVVEDEARMAGWYTGPEEGDRDLASVESQTRVWKLERCCGRDR